MALATAAIVHAPSVHAAVAASDKFTIVIAGFNNAGTTGYLLGSPVLATFGTTQTVTAAGVNGQDYTISSSEVIGPTTTTDSFKFSTPTSFITTPTYMGTTISHLQLDLGDSNSGIGLAGGANPVNFALPISSYTVAGNAVYGAANNVVSLNPNLVLANGNLSFTVGESVGTGSDTDAISLLAIHEFNFSITYPNPVAVATTTTITTAAPLQSVYGQGYSITVAAAATSGSTQPTAGTVTCTLQPLPSGTATVLGTAAINAANATAQCAVPALQPAGSYSVTAVYSGSGLFTGSSSGASTLTIAPAALTIAPTAGQTKVYGSSDPAVFAYTTSSLTGTSTVAGVLGRVAGENVGSYAYTLGSVAVSDAGNYTVSLAPGNTFAITPVVTSLALTSPCSPIFVGGGNETYTLSATVLPANVPGSVTFKVRGVAVCSNVPLNTGAASCAINNLDAQGGAPVETLQFSAAYGGDTNRAASSATSGALVIGAAEAILRNGFEAVVPQCPVE